MLQHRVGRTPGAPSVQVEHEEGRHQVRHALRIVALQPAPRPAPAEPVERRPDGLPAVFGARRQRVEVHLGAGDARAADRSRQAHPERRPLAARPEQAGDLPGPLQARDAQAFQPVPRTRTAPSSPGDLGRDLGRCRRQVGLGIDPGAHPLQVPDRLVGPVVVPGGGKPRRRRWRGSSSTMSSCRVFQFGPGCSALSYEPLRASVSRGSPRCAARSTT